MWHSKNDDMLNTRAQAKKLPLSFQQHFFQLNFNWINLKRNRCDGYKMRIAHIRLACKWNVISYDLSATIDFILHKWKALMHNCQFCIKMTIFCQRNMNIFNLIMRSRLEAVIFFMLQLCLRYYLFLFRPSKNLISHLSISKCILTKKVFLKC